MLWFHPLLQALTTLGALYVLFLGAHRFAAAHLGIKTVFAWKRHVFLGMGVLLLWLAGFTGGSVMAANTWGTEFVSGTHYWVGLAMATLIPVVFGTGLRMDMNKARRSRLPLFHGALGVALIALALTQAVTGIALIRTWIVGG